MKKNSIFFGVLGSVVLGSVVLGSVVLVAVVLLWRRELVNVRPKKQRGTARLPAGPESSESTIDDKPTESDIANLARQFWEEEGKPDGKAQEHWERAQQELRRHPFAATATL